MTDDAALEQPQEEASLLPTATFIFDGEGSATFSMVLSDSVKVAQLMGLVGWLEWWCRYQFTQSAVEKAQAEAVQQQAQAALRAQLGNLRA